MLKIIFIFLAINLSALCLRAQERQQVYYTNLDVLNKPTSSSTAQFTYTVYELPNQTYGYVIFADGQKYLRQHNMPGKDTNTGFANKADAEKVAKIVIGKLQIPVTPATVNTIEMLYWGIK